MKLHITGMYVDEMGDLRPINETEVDAPQALWESLQALYPGRKPDFAMIGNERAKYASDDLGSPVGIDGERG